MYKHIHCLETKYTKKLPNLKTILALWHQTIHTEPNIQEKLNKHSGELSKKEKEKKKCNETKIKNK